MKTTKLSLLMMASVMLLGVVGSVNAESIKIKVICAEGKVASDYFVQKGWLKHQYGNLPVWWESKTTGPRSGLSMGDLIASARLTTKTDPTNNPNPGLTFAGAEVITEGPGQYHVICKYNIGNPTMHNYFPGDFSFQSTPIMERNLSCKINDRTVDCEAPIDPITKT